MADPSIGRPFAMPMVNDFVPKTIRPWIYLLFTVIFQMCDGIYLGTTEQMMGELNMMREDVMFVFMCCVVGVAMPFPILFRLKFRFTNRQLEIFSISGLIITVAVPLFTTWMPILCVSSYLCGYFKLMATFECFSNIQLWMTPKRDFKIFFPLLYIVVLADMSMAGWVSVELGHYFGSWQAMQYFIIGLLSLVLLYFITCTHNFRFMRPYPFFSIDFLGCALWSVALLTGIWIFNYGEYYNWWDSTLWRTVLFIWPVTIFAAFHRMFRIHHAYILPQAFKYKTLIPILFMFIIAELMNSTPKVLENTFTGAILHYGIMTGNRFNLVNIAGNITGCIFCMFWWKSWRQKYTRLLTVGFSCLLLYQIMMYFYITPQLNIESLYLPTFIRNFGYSIFFVTLTLYLEELMDLRHFFMGLTIAGFIRNGLLDNVCTGIYSYLLRYHVADNLAIGLPFSATESMMMGVKQLYGATCIGGVFFLLLLMLYDVQPIRSSLKHVPVWNKVGKAMKEEMRRPKDHNPL